MGCVHRSRSLLDTMRFAVSQCWLISAGSMMKISEQDILTIRVWMRRSFLIKNHGKLYSNSGAKGNQKAATENEISGGNAMFPLRCGNCGKLGHHVPEWNNTTPNYGEQGHINTYYEKPKKEPGVGQNVQAKAKVFAFSGAEVSRSDNLIWGTRFINGIPLIYIINIGATYLFVSNYCVIKLNLVVSPMKGNMVIDTPTNGFVTTLLGCLNCPLSIYGNDFQVDLICLPLSQLVVILGMN